MTRTHRERLTRLAEWRARVERVQTYPQLGDLKAELLRRQQYVQGWEHRVERARADTRLGEYQPAMVNMSETGLAVSRAECAQAEQALREAAALPYDRATRGLALALVAVAVALVAARWPALVRIITGE